MVKQEREVRERNCRERETRQTIDLLIVPC